MRKHIAIAIIGVVLVLAAIAVGLLFDIGRKEDPLVVRSFEECAQAGYPIMESFPRQCRTPYGDTFTEEVRADTVSDMIQVETPIPDTYVTSPLAIRGEARGPWYFEASFPIELVDSNGIQLASGVAQAEGEWMTTAFVPFRTTLTFVPGAATSGTLILHRDNPSGLPEHDAELRIPVRFASTSAMVGN